MNNEQEKPIDESKMTEAWSKHFDEKQNEQHMDIENTNIIPDTTPPVTTLSIISKIFYGFSVLTAIGLFSYLSGITLANVEIMSIQFLIICSYFTSAFIFFSFAELFEAVNRIEKNTKK
jgi:hypothetical protein